MKVKFHRNPASSTSEIYEYKIPILEEVQTEDFLIFLKNLQKTMESTGAI